MDCRDIRRAPSAFDGAITSMFTMLRDGRSRAVLLIAKFKNLTLLLGEEVNV